MYINNIYSIGPHCCPRMRIDYIKKSYNIEIKETNFFDYLMVNIETIINILKIENINDIININNIEIYNITQHNLYIKFKNIYLDSIHDIPNTLNITYDDLVKNKDEIFKDNYDNINKSFIEKYIRRYDRLINILKNNDNICFIYQNYISKEDYLKLNEAFIKFTNKKIIVICFQDFGPEKNIIENYNNLYYLNYYSMYLTKDYIYEPEMKFLNWDEIFQNIKNIYNMSFNN